MLARKQMHILWINKITDKEYWRTTQLELTKSLKKRGNQVTLVMAKNIGENKTKEDDIIYLPTVPNHLFSGLIFGLFLLFYLPLIIRKKKIDIIMIDVTSIWLPFTIPLKLLFNIPIITDVRDYFENKDFKKIMEDSLKSGDTKKLVDMTLTETGYKTKVPDWLISAPEKEQKSFLQGLTDSEAWITCYLKPMGVSNMQISFGVTDSWIDDVYEMFKQRPFTRR